jgi:hypothetical protein
MAVIIGQDTLGTYGTWAWLRTPITLPGSNAVLGYGTIEYVTGFAFHAGFKVTAGNLMRGNKQGTQDPSFGFTIGSGGNMYFYSNFYTGAGGNNGNSIDESHALALIGQTVTLDGGTTFTITADYKNTLNGQLVFGPSPPGPMPSSFDIDQVGLLTAFDS